MKRVNSVLDNRIYGDDEQIRRLVNRYHTPTFVFDEESIRQNCRDLKEAIKYEKFKILYAAKALTIGPILSIPLDEGCGIDASSINEVRRARLAGAPPSMIFYTGEGATASVYAALVAEDVLVNCTSIDQMHLLGQVGGKRCSIRINPGEGDGETNKTNTGGPSSKHGIYHTELDLALQTAAELGIAIIGIHSHIGSGAKLNSWLSIKDKTLEFARRLPDLEIVNLGGGLPVVYREDADQPMPLEEWGRALSDSMRQFSREIGRPIELRIEPGRYIVASYGLLIAQVQAVKATAREGDARGYNFAIVNTGLNHNIRPSLYGAYHPIRFVPMNDGEQRIKRSEYVVAGYLCESGDVFTISKDHTLEPREFPEIRVGDIMVMAGIGAYSHSMKSEYNSMNLPASILMNRAGGMRVIERRGTLQDIMRREIDVYSDDEN